MKRKLRRALSSALALTLLLLLLCPQAWAASSGKFGKTKNLTWSYKGDTLVISGKGEMNDFDSQYWGFHTTPWQSAGGQMAKTLIIEEGVTTLGTYAFDGFSRLTTVCLPDSLTEIREGAFTFCPVLQKVTIPGGVKSLGRYLFSRCPKLTRLTLCGSSTVFEDYSVGYYYEDVAEGENVFLDKDFMSALTIVGPRSSTAQAYAEKYQVNFELYQQPKPAKTTLRSVKSAKGRKLIASWACNTSGKGYELQYSTDKKLKKSVKKRKISQISTTSVTIPKLSRGKTYYVRIRTVSGKKVSGWSGVKKVKIKK